MNQPLECFARRLTLIGCGSMAGAMLARWLECGLDPALVEVVRPSGADVAPGVRVVTAPAELAATPADILLLGFKPQQLAELAPSLRTLIGPDTIVLSILAGVTLDDLRRPLQAARVVRAMPNIPVRSGNGIVLLAGEQDADIDTLMHTLGMANWLDGEASFDLYTAIAGSGPAFVYAFMDTMASAGVRLGLPMEDAAALSRAMIIGSVANIADSDVPPADLIRQVASAGGMTQAGLDVLEEDGRFAALLTEMLRAARDRGKDLAEAARG